MEDKPHNQEIDLLELLAWCYGFLRENWRVAVFLPMMGAVLGLIFYFTTPPKFQSKMMMVSEMLTDTECDYLMQQLESTDSLNPLMTGEFKNFVTLKHTIKKDTWSKAAHIEIIIVVRNYDLLVPTQNTIIGFLERSEAATNRVSESKEYHKQMIAEIDEELQSIEAVKSQSDGKAKANFLTPSDLFATSLNLRERKINLQIRMKDIRAFRPVHNINLMSKKLKKPALLSTAVGFAGGTLILTLVLFIKFFLSYYKRYEQTHAA